ncbi:MAG: hypothetical protein J5J00_10775 [Deltaproteobacteria bacterium]|nr:hypothetical protein [Deltaproteobacteria bacterium]
MVIRSLSLLILFLMLLSVSLAWAERKGKQTQGAISQKICFHTKVSKKKAAQCLRFYEDHPLMKAKIDRVMRGIRPTFILMPEEQYKKLPSATTVKGRTAFEESGSGFSIDKIVDAAFEHLDSNKDGTITDKEVQRSIQKGIDAAGLGQLITLGLDKEVNRTIACLKKIIKIAPKLWKELFPKGAKKQDLVKLLQEVDANDDNKIGGDEVPDWLRNQDAKTRELFIDLFMAVKECLPEPTPTPTPTSTPKETSSASFTPEASITPEIIETAIFTATPLPTLTVEPTATPLPTSTLGVPTSTPLATFTPFQPTLTPLPTFSVPADPTATNTPQYTYTPAETSTPETTTTISPTVSPEGWASQTPSPTVSPISSAG